MKLLNQDTVTILKWVITILITGFIAQFGKKLANFIIDKARERRSSRTANSSKKKEIDNIEDNSSADNQKELLKAQTKIEKEKQKQTKKMAKAKEKAAKKQYKE
ncbi:MAG: hypothetical protein ACOCX9_00310 [Spirochaetota bacterium]